MKHQLVGGIVAAVVLISFTFVQAQYNDPELGLAVEWMHANNMTRYDAPSRYHPELWVSREQATRLLGQYAIEVKGMKQLDSYPCEFNDLDEADATLTTYIKDACETGIFKGSHGKFFPKGNLSKAQAITVLVRILEGDEDETTTPWRRNYFTAAKQLELTKETDVRALDRPVTRYELALMIYRAEHGMASEEELDLAELKQILQDLGLRTE